MLRLIAAILSACSLAFTATQASAAWHKAESDHFVIYADDSERDIRKFTANLEKFHRALEIALKRQVPSPSPSNRVTIFVVGNQGDLRKILDTKSRTIGGVYIPRAGASRAYVQDIRNRTGGYPHFSTVVLLHEYVHHFMISSSRFAMPRWLSEGAAEYFASATFKSDGGLQIGLPAQHRAGELHYADPVHVRELLDHELYERNRGRRYDAFYGRSWLLYHYLTFSEKRAGQLAAYWQLVLEGEGATQAGEKAFGDLDALENELNRYLLGKFPFFTIAGEHLPVREITITRLSRGEAKMMRVRMASQRGVNAEQAAELVEDARKIAGEYPQDAGVLTALAEAEYDAGFDARAIAAADSALALDPSRANAYVQKGYALFRMARDAEDEAAAFNAAMEPFQQLNQRENDHPVPLIYYYRSFAERGAEPPENARAALERAAELAPFDQRLWLQVAVMQAQEGKIELAKVSLQPLASDPHGGGRVTAAKRMIELLDQVPEGEKLSISGNFYDEDGEDAGDEEPEGEEKS